jgi:NADPH:quinone reductase-like Zn-dependent oxidoreductase
MKAVVLTGYGDVDNLELRDLPDPHAGAGAIVVRMAAASINPVDWKIRSGSAKGRHPIELPFVLGCDASGQVRGPKNGVHFIKVGSFLTLSHSRSKR